MNEMATKARHVTRDLDPEDELINLRIRTKNKEVILSHSAEFIIIVIHVFSALDLAWLTSGQVAQTVLQGKAQQPTRDHSVQNYTPAAKGNATSKGTAAPVDTAMAPSMPQSGQNGISINSHVRSRVVAGVHY
jgi:hypothetical protein